jgi:alkanesulfonate monooxygenase SsuD/methylene tetrahydromethanopterin reductase-like flavin-dependent oxidoreductase (luciferase family)
MSGLRAGLGLPGADAGTVQRAARLAEEWNVDSLWIGDPAHRAANADDTYVMVAAAAAAAATTHVRLGVFLSARSSAPPLRIAEDIGVVDQIAGGRLSVAFSPPATSPADDSWLADLERIARAPREWDLGDGRRMPITPPPAQPAVPMAVFARADDSTARPLATAWSPGLLTVDWPDATTPPSPDDLLRMKARADDARVAEVILLADPAADVDAVFAVVGTVVAPCLRAADHEVGILALDATRWLHERAALHHPPN